VSEVLGGGDATQPHQRFVLKQKPLTYTPAANPSGGETSLEIWVNDAKWREVPSLFGRGPRERVYVTRLADDGTVSVVFGDGASGARLPTGQENVRAVYRKGIGLEGLAKAEQLSLLMTRPLGVKSVLNPRASEGAADPQSLSDARRNAPLTVLTLDRVVSLQDYEDFARGFSGIAKALATWTWNVRSRGVFITVAGPAGAAVADDSATRAHLLGALGSVQKPGEPAAVTFGNPLVPVQVKSYTPVEFRLKGTVYVAADRVPEKVLTAVRDALKAAFSFEARAFGQPVALSEVESVIHNVPGVVAVDVDALDKAPGHRLRNIVTAAKPASGAAADQAQPAELLTLDETSLTDLVVKSYALRR
jgi:predicted phage baseplate assembly protein